MAESAIEMISYSEFYLDESGNTGDLSTVKVDAYFTEQRMFALAAFGSSLNTAFVDAFNALKAEHRIQRTEVKCKHVYEKPRFILGILDLLESHSCPVFIEAVDKHYFVVVNIIERMVMPYVGICDYQPSALWVKGMMADYMALYAPPALVYAFAACCQSRNYTEIRELYKRIIQWAEASDMPPTEEAQAISRFTRDSLKDFRKLSKLRAVEQALPIPDKNPAGKLIWVLPNLTSFTNIYARINRFTARRVSGVTLFHHEQLQFGDIIQHNKGLAEGLKSLDLNLPLKASNFQFDEAADLQFVRSHESIGIQIADLLAGFIARYIQDAVWGGVALHRDKVTIFDRLVGMGDQSLGTGINFVTPNSLIRFLGVRPQWNF